MWHVTCDTWHVTCDTWHVTCNTWHVWGGWTFSQNFSSLALPVCDLWYYEDLEEKGHWISQWMNDKAVYRTALATPGLLINCEFLQLLELWAIQQSTSIWEIRTIQQKIRQERQVVFYFWKEEWEKHLYCEAAPGMASVSRAVLRFIGLQTKDYADLKLMSYSKGSGNVSSLNLYWPLDPPLTIPFTALADDCSLLELKYIQIKEIFHLIVTECSSITHHPLSLFFQLVFPLSWRWNLQWIIA